MKTRLFNGVSYIARKDIYVPHIPWWRSHDIGNYCKKMCNERYYISVSDYEDRKAHYWRRRFRQSVHRRMKTRNDRIKQWSRLLSAIVHRDRCERLVMTLRLTTFDARIRSSRLYASVKDRIRQDKTCSRCGMEMSFALGVCECHLCENWITTSCNNIRTPYLKCKNCAFRKPTNPGLSITRYPYLYV